MGGFQDVRARIGPRVGTLPRLLVTLRRRTARAVAEASPAMRCVARRRHSHRSVMRAALLLLRNDDGQVRGCVVCAVGSHLRCSLVLDWKGSSQSGLSATIEQAPLMPGAGSRPAVRLPALRPRCLRGSQAGRPRRGRRHAAAARRAGAKSDRHAAPLPRLERRLPEPRRGRVAASPTCAMLSPPTRSQPGSACPSSPATWPRRSSRSTPPEGQGRRGHRYPGDDETPAVAGVSADRGARIWNRGPLLPQPGPGLSR
jgi:hypothetical protein